MNRETEDDGINTTPLPYHRRRRPNEQHDGGEQQSQQRYSTNDGEQRQSMMGMGMVPSSYYSDFQTRSSFNPNSHSRVDVDSQLPQQQRMTTRMPMQQSYQDQYQDMDSSNALTGFRQQSSQQQLVPSSYHPQSQPLLPQTMYQALSQPEQFRNDHFQQQSQQSYLNLNMNMNVNLAARPQQLSMASPSWNHPQQFSVDNQSSQSQSVLQNQQQEHPPFTAQPPQMIQQPFIPSLSYAANINSFQSPIAASAQHRRKSVVDTIANASRNSAPLTMGRSQLALLPHEEKLTLDQSHSDQGGIEEDRKPPAVSSPRGSSLASGNKKPAPPVSASKPSSKSEHLLQYGGLLEVSSGKFVKMRGTQVAEAAVKNGKAIVVQCVSCLQLYQVKYSAKVLYCKACQQFTPLAATLHNRRRSSLSTISMMGNSSISGKRDSSEEEADTKPSSSSHTGGEGVGMSADV